MTAVERIQAAIDKLTTIKKDSLGLMLVLDDGDLLARADDDIDDDGNRFWFGLNLQGIDSNREVNEAIVTLHRTIDAQLAILRLALGDARGSEYCWQFALPLANAILGADS